MRAVLVVSRFCLLSSPDYHARRYMTVFTRIDTIVLRVTDYSAASDWYCRIRVHGRLCRSREGLAVLGLGQGTSLTLWQLQPGEAGPKDSSGCRFPSSRAATAPLNAVN